jgi:transcriptional regulator with XRE-family HTH domain
MGSKDPKIGDIRVVDEKQIIAEEDLVIDAQFLIQEALIERGMTRSELAQRSGISKARLSQIMRADANPTLRTLAKLFYAMDDQLWLSRKEKMVARGADYQSRSEKFINSDKAF